MYELSQLPGARLQDVLEDQYGALARWQARALGLSDDAFDRRVRAGAFALRHQGVAVAQAWRHHELMPLAAGVLRAGPRAHLSLWSAAGLLDVDLRGSTDLEHLWVPHADRRPSPTTGLELRRTRLLSSAVDVTVRRGLPVTTVERAVVDRMAQTSEVRLRACARRRLHGARQLRDLMGIVSPHDSGLELELELDRLTMSVGIHCQPLTTIVHADGTCDEVDLLALAAGVVLEADGWAFHGDPAQREADELRDERLRALGLIVLRFTSRQIREQPEVPRRRIASHCDGRTWAPPAGVRLERKLAAAA